MTGCAIAWRAVQIFAVLCTCVFCRDPLWSTSSKTKTKTKTMPWLIALLLGNPCEHIYILDNWETQFIVTWQLRVTLGSIQYSCNVLDQFSFWSSFSHLLLILSHICQSTVGSRMSWSNIFDFLWMSKQVGRVGPCFFPGGPKSWVRGQSRFIHFTFSPAGWSRGLCSSCRGGLVSWPQVPQEPSTTCTFLQLCQHLCPHLLQTSARESLVWKLLEWFTNLWLYFNTGAWRIISWQSLAHMRWRLRKSMTVANLGAFLAISFPPSSTSANIWLTRWSSKC